MVSVVVVTCLFMVLDVVTGFSQACKTKTVSSTVMRDGLYHKLGFIGAIILGVLCEYAEFYIDLGFSLPLVIPICCFICWTEIVSIKETLKILAPELSSDGFTGLFKKNEK